MADQWIIRGKYRWRDILSTYYVLNTVLGTRNTLMKRPDVVPTLMELTLELRRETKLKVATLYQKKKKLQWTNA